jgi:hypothetical protein
MNIYFLHRDPRRAAEAHCNKDVRTQIVASCQLLSTAHRMLDGIYKNRGWRLQDEREKILYRATDISHPCSRWVRGDLDHYRWVHDLLYFLIGEYKYRWGDKEHRCQKLQMYLLDAPYNIPIAKWKDPPLMIADDCVTVDSVQSYRLYYAKYNSKSAKWTRRETPGWWKATCKDSKTS